MADVASPQPSAKGRKGSRKGSRDSQRSKSKEDEHTAPPEGVVPIFLATKTQEIFECLVDNQVTDDKPMKLISKEAALADMMERKAVSDFSPMKKIIEDYPADEFLVVYDFDFLYGQNFYMCITEEAKKKMMGFGGDAGDKKERGEDERASGEGSGELSRDSGKVYVYKPPEPKEWIEMGAEEEITHERVLDNRPLIRYRASRVRRLFGSPINFGERPADVTDAGKLFSSYVACPSYEDNNKLAKLEIDVAVQAVAVVKDTPSQTTWSDPVNQASQTQPREFTAEQQEKVRGKKSYARAVQRTLPRFELAIQQNLITNAFENDWIGLGEEDAEFGVKSDNHLKEYQSFTDLEYSKDKTVSHVDWHPDIRGVIGVSCCERLSAYERIDQASKLAMRNSLVLIWSFTDPIHPQFLLSAPDDVSCFAFCPTNPNYIAGGCLNGQVVMWDISEHHDKLVNARPNVKKGAQPKAMFGEEIPPDVPTIRYSAVSSIEHSHSAAIATLDWVPRHFEYNQKGQGQENRAGDCHQLMTTGNDGLIMVWDIAKPVVANPKKTIEIKKDDSPLGISQTFAHLDLTWRPVIRCKYNKEETKQFPFMCVAWEEAHGVSDHIPPVEPIPEDAKKIPPPKVHEQVKSYFFTGTEDGELVYGQYKPCIGNDKAKDPEMSSRWFKAVHDGPVVALHRNTFLRDLLLSVGGHTFHLYKEGVQTPILSSACSSQYYTAGHWSLTRPSVFFLCNAGGDIEVWDLLDRTHEPVFVQSVTAAKITKVLPHAVTRKQHLLAVTDNVGTLHILEVPWNLHHPTHNEMSSLEEYVSREVQRLEFMEQRHEAERAAALDAKEDKQKDQEPVAEEEKDFDELLLEEYGKYEEFEKKLLVQLGIVQLEA